MDRARKNVLVLAACQALLFTHNVILISINGLAGFALAEVKALATLPVTAYVVGGALSTLPASFWMKRVGRRAGFMTGAAFGFAGAAVCTLAVHLESFWTLCLGTLVAGVYNAFGQYYRFAAAETASLDFKSKAISLVMAGGIAGGVLGPESSKLTLDLLWAPYMGSYASLMGFSVIAMLLSRFIDIPPMEEHERRVAGRPLSRIMAQPAFAVAVLSAMVGYGVMNLLMTATPIAMTQHHHPYHDAAFVIEWHVIGMFAPSFVTGSLIQRFGVVPVILTGVALMFACVGVALAGVAVMNFWLALFLLGVGWNFMFVGGTTLLTETHTPAERAKTQGVNDFLIFLTLATSSFSSGVLISGQGWQLLNLWSLPFLLVTGTAAAWLLLQRRAGRLAA
ncbi:MFS transporter [Pelomicrobium sp. G1]|uniref:MFS transporter n=1 Tax=unclassified Pelomicrobium TaxID=2815318 RepID=UPI0021DBB23A|nr:MAG: MFS transporter [Burkholderiales bacterium]